MNDIKNRLLHVKTMDMTKNFRYLNDILRSDLYILLSNYFEVTFDDILSEVQVCNDGTFNISISAKASRVKLPRVGQF